MNRKDLLYSFYVLKNYDELKNILADSPNNDEKIILAMIYLEEERYEEAEKYFKEAGRLYETGRCRLLLGDSEGAKQIWNSANCDSLPILWSLNLLQFIDRYVTSIPTFFQIRGFLEVDLDALLKAKQFTFCENIINGADLFARSNTETYKFIGRVFVNNNMYDMAEIYLKKAKDVCYIDPEVHFLIAKCNLVKNRRDKAIANLKTCLGNAPEYYPASKLLSQIKLG